MNKLWIYGFVFVVALTFVSAIVIDGLAINKLRAIKRGNDLRITGEVFNTDLDNTGTIKAFCKHNNNIYYIGSMDYYLTRSAYGYMQSFSIWGDSNECTKNDLAWVEINNYKSEDVIITSKHHHKILDIFKTPEQVCLEDSTKQWVEGQCTDKVVELTDEEKCLLDSTMEWVDNECVLKEVPKCYTNICEDVATTCNTYNYEQVCEQVQSDCNTWNYNSICHDVFTDVWYKEHTHQLCTSHNHQNCYKETVKTTECENVQTTCNTYNYEQVCEDVQGDCNTWSYKEVCELVETSCEV